MPQTPNLIIRCIYYEIEQKVRQFQIFIPKDLKVDFIVAKRAQGRQIDEGRPCLFVRSESPSPRIARYCSLKLTKSLKCLLLLLN